MKNTGFNILGLGLAAMVAGCSGDFLDVSSKTDLNSGSAYQTEVQAEYALVGCYDGYQRTVSNGNWPTLYQAVETMSDDCLGGGGPDDRTDRLMDRFDLNYKSDQIDIFEGIWEDYYAGIYRCNMLLANLEGISFSSDEAKATLEGEARAIRAIEYFDMVRMFENVPLVTVPTDAIVPQSPVDDVYQQIVADLTFAAENIPATKYADKNSSLGRITRYAAEGMLARVYLFYDGVYNNNAGGEVPGGLTKAKALSYCEDIISSGNYQLEPEFKNLWPAACTEKSTKDEGKKTTYVEASNEILLVMKFNNDQNWSNSQINGNRFVVNFGLRNVTDYAPYGNGWGACPITPYAATLFSTDDLRANATIINCKAVGCYDKQIATDCMDYTGLVNMKYCPLIFDGGDSMPVAESTVEGANFQTSQDQNWILLRYADVLLMAAELGSGSGATYFNMVRERAYGDSSHNLGSAPSRDQVWSERRKEFMCEGVRYWDLLRQGLDVFVDAQMGQATSNGLKSGTSISVYDNSAVTTDIKNTYVESNIRTKRGFFQIPASQIALSDNVYKQNAGW